MPLAKSSRQEADAWLQAHRENRQFVTALLREKIAFLEAKNADATIERLRAEGLQQLQERIEELDRGI